ncbi:type I methionyl aminopeptidase [Helicobacter sp. CLO-3]|uniref:type I methionyl aminopeptidase n=1 Tax=unclassified Helicobacter TaxID=2593540 RepID=UPI00080530F3|nr:MULTISPECIES: type I methionyl aminopeptidase [unclassified Helicobacter]OBV28983.1 type I methionyl aminopeptidase [Helicobacter sp. CLO-3]OHU84828.1 type I methionyl aminopeptidase [Helicobacter sp. CLO-3]
MAIAIRSKKDISMLAKASSIVARTLDKVSAHAKVGVSLKELDLIAEDYILSQQAKPAFKGLYGFPNTTCLSLNEVIIHGIPSDYKLKEGDILGIDLGAEIGGWFGDGAVTIGIGKIDSSDEALIDCTKDTLYKAIDAIKVGMHFKELSLFLENTIKSKGYVPLDGFCGHGIGRRPHEEPEIPNLLGAPNPKQGPKIKEGMVFCIEPMICQKDGAPVILADKWSVVSQDGLNGSHYEHTIAIIDGKARILTQA